MEGFDQGVALESPPSTDPSFSTDPSSAGTQNTEQQQGQVVTDSRGNVIPPWRVNEMVQQASERAVAQAEQRFAQERQQLLQSFDQRSREQQQSIMQALQQRVTQPSRSAEEEAQRRQAQELLHDLAPGLKAMPALAQAAIEQRARMDKLEQAAAQSDQRSTRMFISGEQSRLPQMAAAAGLSFTPQQGAAFEEFVTGIIRGNPEAHAAFVSGDQRILPWAFDLARQQYAAQQQFARASIAQTKSRMPPPRIGGSTPGSPPKPQFDRNDPRGSMAKIHAGAEADLMARLGG